jgi:acetate kinase
VAHRTRRAQPGPTCAKASPSAPGSSACPADARDLVAAVEGDADAALALAVFAHRARRELAAATSLPTLDALVFTGEIGWGRPEVRRQLTDGLAILGTDHRVLVVEPHAEREIARLTAATLHSP